MTPENWQRLKPLFEKALELTPTERAAFVDELRREDEELATELSLLLRGHDERTWSLDQPFITARAFFDQEPTIFAPGKTVLGRFRIGELLGRGGMGEVYKATDLELGEVALKTIRPEIACDPEMLARLRLEVQLARRITSPSVCRIHELFVVPGEAGRPASAFLSMELLEGRTLAERVRTEGQLQWKEAETIARQLCEGLQAIHRAGVIHRDLKSRNIMLTLRNGVVQAVVMDFGLARQAVIAISAGAADLGGIQAVAGTPNYMAPEQFECGPVSPATDVYALGVVLYEMVTGVLPFVASSTLAVAVRRAKRLPRASSIQHGLPRRWDEVIEHCLEYDAKDRYQSAAEVAWALGVKPFSVAAMQQKVAVARAHRLLSTALLVGFVAILAFGFLWLWLHRYRQPSPEAQRWYKDGVAALREGTYLKAANALKQALANDNDFALAHARLADAYNELDYSGEAKDEVLQASAPAFSQNLPALDRQYLEAIRASVLHDYTAAVREYQRISRALPRSAKADGYVDIGRAYEKIGDLPHALENYRAATKIAPQYPAAFIRIGALQGRQNQTAAAEKAFQTAEDLYRASSNYEGIAEIEYQRGDVAAGNLDQKSARPLLMGALAFGHLHSAQLQARVLCRLSALEHAARKDEQAEIWAQQALAAAQAEGLGYWAMEAQCRLASARAYQKGRLSDADHDAEGVLQAANRNRWPLLAAEARLTLAIIRNRQKRPAEAEQFAQAALDYYTQAGYFTESTRASILMIRAKRDAAEFHDALALCQQGLELERKSGSPPVMIQMEEAAGTVYLAVEQYPEALRHFNIAAEIARQNGSYLLDYEVVHVADALWRLGDYSNADQKLNSLSADASKDNYLFNTVYSVLPEMRLSQGRYRDALAATKRAQTSDPGVPSPTANRVAALARLRLGSRQEALRLAIMALSEAQNGLNEVSLANARVVSADVYLQNASPGDAKALADSALATFSRLDQPESEWRTLALLSRISAELADKTSSKNYALKSLDILSALEHNWGTPTYQRYSERPDVSAIIRDLHVLAHQRAAKEQ